MDKNFSDLIKESITDEEERIANNLKENSKPNLNTLRRKIRKNFFVGFGTGLMVAACAFFIFRPAKEPEVVSNLNEELSKEEIIKEAKILGMEFPSDTINIATDNIN